MRLDENSAPWQNCLMVMAKTKLAKLFDEKFGLGTQDAIIDAVYGEKYDLSSVVPVLMEAASKGYSVAKKILILACPDLLK